MKHQLASLYTRRFGHEPASIENLRADGSDRKLYRLIDPNGSAVVGVYGPDHEENRAFLSFSRAFRSIGLPVPEIHAADEEAGIYLEEDLGNTNLFDALTAVRTGDEFPASIVPIYKSVVAMLPRFQVEGGNVVDYSVAYPYQEFDRRSIMWDLNYFKYHFLKPAKVRFNEARLENDFVHFSDFLLGADRSHFLYRDFQSRNIMLRSGEPWFIDYQGGRRGALQYDIASLLYDAKAALPDALRRELLDDYLTALAGHVAVERGQFMELYRGYVLVRVMQAMGAYGYRGIFERKPHFLASIPYAVANVRGILEQGPLPVDLPELRAAFEQIIDSELLRHLAEGDGNATNGTERTTSTGGREAPAATGAVPATPPSGLTVHIRSFSYKRGYPEETSGHGGGFVFDCRALHNPGRYDEYKTLSGCDAPVVEFLEREPEVERFWANVRELVDASVATYLAREFQHLSVSFGCTGGQHRSVYFAERLARHLREHYPTVALDLGHREESVWVREAGVASPKEQEA